MSGTADVVVAGAGHNGLVAAAYLAKSGLKVTVIEARPVIGGGATTEELTLPGFRHDPFATGHFGMLANPAFSRDELPLARYGLAYVAPDPVVALPTAEGFIALWHDESRTAAEFAKYSADDAAAWRALCRDWDAAAFGLLRTVGNAPAAATPLPPALQALAASSALDVIESRFRSPEARMLLTWLVAITCQPVDRPGTGPLALSLPVPLSRAGWVNAIGGAVALPEALAAYVRDSGGEVVTGAPAVAVVLEDGVARGIRVADGRSFRATRAVLSSLHFTQLPWLVPDLALPRPFLDGIARWETGPGLFVVHLAVEGNPAVRSSGARGLPSVLTGSISPAGLRRQLADIGAGRASHHDDIWLLAACSTAVDPTRAPPGKGVVKLMTMAPYALDGDPANWAAAKESYADFLTELYARAVTGYRPGSELARSVASPVDLERANPSFVGGSPQGGHALPSQAGLNRPVAGWAAYESPVPGLFQTGLSTHPGGAVNGWAGRNAARAILAHLGMDADRLIPPV